MVKDSRSTGYKNKESIVMVNLLSNSRPNDPKLVGQVVVDLSSVTPNNKYAEIRQYPLEYCSVSGSIYFRVIMRN